jgi:hypothetical protein
VDPIQDDALGRQQDRPGTTGDQRGPTHQHPEPRGRTASRP